MSDESPKPKTVRNWYFGICISVLVIHLALPSNPTTTWIYGYLSVLANIITVFGLPYLLYTLSKEKPFV